MHSPNQKAIFLDRDGTINVDHGYVHRVEDFEYIPGAVEGMKLLNEAGFQLIIVTNQSGIARGLYSESDYLGLDAWMRADLAKRGVHIAATYHCPHHPEFTGPCSCRKPGTALFFQAASELGINFDASWAIGDRPRDLSICWCTGCRGVILGKEGVEGIEAASNLYEATLSIVNNRLPHVGKGLLR